MNITWKNFPLEQVNSKEGEDWKLWEQPESYASRGLLALRAGEAAKKQGMDAFNKFHVTLLNARHVDRKAIDNMDILVDAATKAGLDVDRFKEDIKDPEALKTIAADYEEAKSKHGVFGVPTIVSEDGNAAFVKMMPPPASDKALEVFEGVFDVVSTKPDVLEIKRPEPPEA
jgi:predicted DsbA family dithiol-disulfide isomerase